MKETSVLIKEFEKGIYRDLLRDIYVDEEVLDSQTDRYIKALKEYEDRFGTENVEIYSAPGRSEVGGNHTDHQYGKVLATSINLDAIAVASRTEDGRIIVASDGYDLMEVDLDDLLAREEEKETSMALIRGVAARLRQRGHRNNGYHSRANQQSA